MDAKPFPGGRPTGLFHVGYAEGSPLFAVRTDLSDGTAVYWELVAPASPDAPDAQAICRYPGVVVDGGFVRGHLPTRYAKQLEQGHLTVLVKPAG